MRHLGGGQAVGGAGGQGARAGGGRGEGVPQADPVRLVAVVGCVDVGVVAGGWTNVVFWTELGVGRQGPGRHGVGGVVRRARHGGRGH